MDFELALPLLLMVVYFVALPASTYLHHEAKHRLRWRQRWLVELPENAPGGPFRDEPVERLHDPSRESGLHAPLELGDCCLWSSTNLVDVPAEAKGGLPDPANDPADYYWGFLFASGDRYYSFRRFPDGLAACVREPDSHQ